MYFAGPNSVSTSSPLTEIRKDGGSTWPHDDTYTTPRSSTVVITKDDGGPIGS